jgi:hypothetical protein
LALVATPARARCCIMVLCMMLVCGGMTLDKQRWGQWVGPAVKCRG